MGDIMEEKKNIPEIRFEGFVGKWEIRKLEEISDSYSGGTPSVGISEFYNGFIPFIRSAEINKNSTELYITELGLLNSSAKLVDVGNILYALYGATSGEVGRSQVKGAINQAILAIIPKNGFDAEFIMQYLRKKKKEIISTYLQGGQGNLSGAIVKKLNIDLPKYVEQSQIGTFFQNLDKQITLEQQKHDKLITLNKAMLEKMFPKEGASVPEIRFEGFVGEWEEKQLDNVAYYRNGKAHENDIEEKGEYVVINSKFVSTDGEIRKFSNKQNEPLYTGEIAFVLSDVPNGRAIARTYLVNENNKYTLNQRIAAIAPTEKTDSFFLYILLNRNKYFLQFDDGAKQTNLSKVDVENFTSFYPNRKEQSKIGSYFQNLDKLISLQQQKIDKFKNIKKACLDKMFV